MFEFRYEKKVNNFFFTFKISCIDRHPRLQQHLHHCRVPLAAGPMYGTGALCAQARQVHRGTALHQVANHLHAAVQCCPVRRRVAVAVPPA